MAWKICFLIAVTAVALWRSDARLVRLLAVVVNLAVLDQYCVFLANVGRNTFEHVERHQPSRDSFRDGVFAEAKAADAFAREQLPVIYAVAICLSMLAMWPVSAKRGAKASLATTEPAE